MMAFLLTELLAQCGRLVNLLDLNFLTTHWGGDGIGDGRRMGRSKNRVGYNARFGSSRFALYGGEARGEQVLFSH
jgi:hypothetical protein